MKDYLEGKGLDAAYPQEALRAHIDAHGLPLTAILHNES